MKRIIKPNLNKKTFSIEFIKLSRAINCNYILDYFLNENQQKESSRI